MKKKQKAKKNSEFACRGYFAGFDSADPEVSRLYYLIQKHFDIACYPKQSVYKIRDTIEDFSTSIIKSFAKDSKRDEGVTSIIIHKSLQQ